MDVLKISSSKKLRTRLLKLGGFTTPQTPQIKFDFVELGFRRNINTSKDQKKNMGECGLFIPHFGKNNYSLPKKSVESSLSFKYLS